MKSRSETIKEFFAAAHAGEVEQVRQMLQRDPSLNQAEDADCFQYRALNIAVWRNNRPLVDVVLDSGVDIDAFDSFESGPWNALQHALNHHHLEMAEYLVERGAAIDVHSAAGLPRMGRLAQLLEADPSLIQARGGDGKMPLHFAANPEVAAFLLERGAEIEARDLDHFSTPAQWAADHRPAVSRFLVGKGAEPDIFMAVSSGDLSWVLEMIQKKPDVL
ncbi:MAG: ankyrin repeat domain-containing protein, partial [Acidobacteriota bacterium]